MQIKSVKSQKGHFVDQLFLSVKEIFETEWYKCFWPSISYIQAKKAQMVRSWYLQENKSESQMKHFIFENKQLGLYSYMKSIQL